MEKINYSQLLGKDFESIWIEDHLNHEWLSQLLPDDVYINYHIWEDINNERMYKKYFPNAVVIRGNNPNIIFHGGCLGCKSQRIHSIDRCKGCQYFKADWDKPNLFIEGEESSSIDLNDILKP